MCDLDCLVQQVHANFAALFDAPPRTLRVRAKGTSLWCNAPLQYASKCGVTLSEAAQYILGHAPHTEGVTSWQVLENGMLQANFTKEALLHAAQAFCVPRTKVEVFDSCDPLFFEKCTAIRAQHVLPAPNFEAEPDGEDQNILADVLLAISQKTKKKDIVRTAQMLEERMDLALKNHRQYDLVCNVLLSALQAQFEKEIVL